jgi:hypothetical protein
MDFKPSLERLTPEIIDSVLSEHFSSYEYLGHVAVPPERAEELHILHSLVDRSEYLREAILAMGDLISNPAYSPEQKAEAIFQKFFLLGWYARGVTDPLTME